MRGWLGGKATTIFGGSHEIQNNIISKRILGLPDPLGPIFELRGRLKHGRIDRRTDPCCATRRAPGPRKSRPVSAFRKMRDSGAPLGYDPAAFAEMAEMGWTGVIIPEEYGGSDFGYLSLGLILEETGRTLTASPLLATALAAASALILGGSDAQKEAWLPKIASGEAGRHAGRSTKARTTRPDKVALAAKKTGAGYTLGGKKTFVLEGMAAGLFVVSARTSGKPGDKDGITLFLVPADAKGVTRKALKLADSRGAANVTFDNVEVGADARARRRRQGLRRCWRRSSTAPAPASPPRCWARPSRPSRPRSTT